MPRAPKKSQPAPESPQLLSALQFVQGAVADAGHSETLSHYRIQYNCIKSANGCITASAPIPLDIAVCPRAVPFTRAIAACKNEQIALTLTPTGRLSIKAGGFRALVDCAPMESWPELDPEGAFYDIPNPQQLLDALGIALAFVAKESPHDWAFGVQLYGQLAMATNGWAAVQVCTGVYVPHRINIPHWTIRELLRLKELPQSLQIAEKSITFHYSGNRWVRSQLYANGGPDIAAFIDAEFHQWEMALQPVPAGMVDTVNTLHPFLDATLTFRCTADALETPQAGAGARIELPNAIFREPCCYAYPALKLALAAAEEMTAGNKRLIFAGPQLRGITAASRYQEDAY